jgi:F-type H+-transporting ATPase subunit epsilon
MATYEHGAAAGAPGEAHGTATTRRMLRCVIVTPERAVLDEPGDYVVLPLYDGELGALPGRAPLIGRLGAGELRLHSAQRIRRFFVDGGFAQVRGNVVTVLTPRAVRAEDLDANAAEQAMAQALVPGRTPAEREARYRDQQRARAMLRIAGRRDGGGGGHH